MTPAYYHKSLTIFLETDPTAVLGELTNAHNFSVEQLQRYAWIEQIKILTSALKCFSSGEILFEFTIPRMGKRADVLLILGSVVVVVEFKVGSTSFDRIAIEQVHDYALDLKTSTREAAAFLLSHCLWPQKLGRRARKSCAGPLTAYPSRL